MSYKKTLIIGIGLIGGSFAKAIRNNKLSTEIIAFDLDSDAIEMAQSDKVIDAGFVDLRYLEDELNSFDLIVIATPLSSYEAIFAKINKFISPKTVVIDLGSVKDLKIKNTPKNFIPCHPIAGLENNGFEYSTTDLFQNKKFIICAQNSAAQEIAKLITAIGAKPEFMSAKEHDKIFALTSHLPQFLSFLTTELSPKNIKDEFLQKAFRLDNSNTEIWSDIFAANEENLEKFYLEFFGNLEKICAKNEKEIFQIMKDLTTNDKAPQNCEWNFIETNFTAILFRLAVVASYLQIREIKKFQAHGGTGFKDFTSIISLLNFDKEKMTALIKTNQKQLQKLLKSIS